MCISPYLCDWLILHFSVIAQIPSLSLLSRANVQHRCHTKVFICCYWNKIRITVDRTVPDVCHDMAFVHLPTWEFCPKRLCSRGSLILVYDHHLFKITWYFHHHCFDNFFSTYLHRYNMICKHLYLVIYYYLYVIVRRQMKFYVSLLYWTMFSFLPGQCLDCCCAMFRLVLDHVHIAMLVLFICFVCLNFYIQPFVLVHFLLCMLWFFKYSKLFSIIFCLIRISFDFWHNRCQYIHILRQT